MFPEFASLPKPNLSNRNANKNQSTKKAPSPNLTFFPCLPAPNLSGFPASNLSDLPAPNLSGFPAPNLSGFPAPNLSGFPAPNLNGFPTPNLVSSVTPTQEKSAEPINANLEDLFQADELNNIEVITGPMPVRTLPSDRQYTLYPLMELMKLVNEIFATLDAKQESKEVVTLRYVVTKNFDILFAREGNPSKYVPAHREMTPDYTGRNCLAAGNIKINRQGLVMSINNKSGDLKPDFYRVVFPLAILSLNQASSPISFPQKFTIIRCSDQQSYSAASEQLPNLVKFFNAETVGKMKSQPTNCIKRNSSQEQTNLSKRQRPIDFVTPRAARRSIFDITSPLEPKKTSSENNSLEDKENINPMSL